MGMVQRFLSSRLLGKSPEGNPKGPADSYDPDEPNAVKHVQRDGLAAK